MFYEVYVQSGSTKAELLLMKTTRKGCRAEAPLMNRNLTSKEARRGACQGEKIAGRNSQRHGRA